MKTKLLKIVRKRYDISLITKVTDPDYFLYSERDKLPLYVTSDNKKSYRGAGYSVYDTAHKQIVTWIRLDYPHKSTHSKKLVISQKVWYNDK
jgi:hypothetical protein